MRHSISLAIAMVAFVLGQLAAPGLLSTALAQSADASSLELVSATRFIVIDSNTGEVFAEQDADVRGGMASLTKVFTALVAIERASSLDQQIVAQESDLFDSTSTTMTGFAPGVAFTVEDLLQGMILESGNDSAQALARGLAAQPGDTPDESVARFVGWMNEKVAELGLTNTHFVNPHGLSDPEHYSTSRDMAAFMMYALQNPAFFDVITTRTYTTSTGVTMTSINRGPEFMESYIGGKTGFDEETGYCLIEVAQRDDVRLVSITIDGVAPDVWYEDHTILLDYGFNALADRLAAGEPIGDNVVAFAQESEPEPTPEVAEPDATTQPDLAFVDSEDDGVIPVRIEGTPVPPTADDGDGGGGMFDNWAIAIVMLALIFGAVGFRAVLANRGGGEIEATPVNEPGTDRESS